MGKLFIPSLSHWQNKNIWSGSLGAGNYYITPQTEVEGVPTEVKVEVWGGKACYELSSPEIKQVFPISHDGLCGMEVWLEEKLAVLNKGVE